MSYLSLSFAAFVLVLVIIYYALPTKARWGVLLTGSVFFYLCFGIKYFPFLLFCALTTFFGAKLIKVKSNKKTIFVTVALFNVAVWFYIKELNWIIDTASRILQRISPDLKLPNLPIIVPIGISYFVLQSLAYLIDVMKGKTQAEQNFFKYLLFLSWFPAIVQGPISRYDSLMNELLNEKRLSFKNTQESLLLILFGLIKKMVIADRLAIFVNNIFSGYSSLYGITLYLGAVGYAFQLYTDFSGCVDICRGVSSLFGIKLVNNFNRPYLSRSVSEFWKKWHISLSSWLKDYIYIPLGGNRKGKKRQLINLMLTFIVSGIWHGAGFNYIAWGVMQGAYQITERSTINLRAKAKAFLGIKADSLKDRICGRVITFNLITLSWIIFRSSGLMSGIDYIKRLVFHPQLWCLFDGSLYEFGLSQNFTILLLLHIFILFAAELLSKSQEDAIKVITNQCILIRWVIYLILILDIVLFGVYGSGYNAASFMYGGF